MVTSIFASSSHKHSQNICADTVGVDLLAAATSRSLISCRETGPASRPRRPREGDRAAPNPSRHHHPLLPSLPASPPPEWFAGKPRGRVDGGGGLFFPSLRRPGADADVWPPGMPLAGAPAAEEARAPRSGAAPTGSGGRVAGARGGGWKGRLPASW
jgi:hypothetical protein